MQHLNEMVEQKDRFGELIGDALRDEAARCHLPSDFAKRLLRTCTVGRDVPVAPQRTLPRWLKVAASLAAMASFVAIAAVVGRVVLNAPEQDESSAPVPSDPETEIISNQGENTMIARKMATLVGAAMVSVAVPAETIESEPTFVFLRPETSSFWNTATNNTMTVPIDYPAGATSATLAITGLGYQRDYLNITKVSKSSNEFSFELPAATSPEMENVYDLTLTFDDGTVRTAKLGLIQGLSPDSEGTTRCLAPVGSKVWNKVKGQAVLPIPYGMKTLKINGIDTDTGLDGAQGWYALGKIEPNETVTLSGVAGGVEYAASLLGGGAGLMMILR